MHLAAASSSTGDAAPVTGPITGPVAVVEVPVSTELLAPIAGVTVEQYVLVSKGVAAHNYDQAKLPLVAAELGIDAAAWATAAAGFNARVSSSPAFAARVSRFLARQLGDLFLRLLKSLKRRVILGRRDGCFLGLVPETVESCLRLVGRTGDGDIDVLRLFQLLRVGFQFRPELVEFGRQPTVRGRVIAILARQLVQFFIKTC